MKTSDAIARVLVVEDDPALSDVVCTFLTGEGYACEPAFTGPDALAAFAAAVAAGTPFDLVICDLMLPGLSGEKLIEQLRTSGGAGTCVPIVVTSAKGAVGDRVGVLRLGANDYLVKPFDLEDLLARVEVQLRGRTGAPGNGGSGPAGASSNPSSEKPLALAANTADGTLTFGAWQLNLSSRELTVDGKPLRLTRTELDLLAVLMAQPDHVFTKRELFERVRHQEALIEERTISTHVANLRAKLKPTGTSGYLQTVWGIGFKLTLS